MTGRVVRVTPDDWRIWRAVRLRALEIDPDAFASSAHTWIDEGDTEERWRLRIASPGRLFVALDEEGRGIAMVGLDLRDGAELISMWVAPHARRRGLGEALVRRVQTEASGRRVTLRVMARNTRAQDFYARSGFSIVTNEPDDEGTITMAWDGSSGPNVWPAPAERPHRSGGWPRARSADQ